jgi:hypothetical protein
MRVTPEKVSKPLGAGRWATARTCRIPQTVLWLQCRSRKWKNSRQFEHYIGLRFPAFRHERTILLPSDHARGAMEGRTRALGACEMCWTR